MRCNVEILTTEHQLKVKILKHKRKAHSHRPKQLNTLKTFTHLYSPDFRWSIIAQSTLINLTANYSRAAGQSYTINVIAI